MKASVTFTMELDKLPTTCSACPFANVCDQMLHGITKRDGMEWSAAAQKRRNKACPLKVEQ